MKKLLKIVGVLVVVLAVAAAGVYVWAKTTTDRLRAETIDTHVVSFPIPFPLDPAEAASLGLNEDAAKDLARQRAVERGRHLVAARYTCTACHGQNFGGGTMVKNFAIGSLLAPNLTLGEGSRTAQYQASDWDRIVRHGVIKEGTPAVMPSDEFQHMSDQELSDIVSYIRSLPPVNNTVPRSTFGPVGYMLVATGKIKYAAMTIANHKAPHDVMPPAESASADFGKHLASVCQGCHGPDFSGGPIAGGDPAWPPARNLTPDATGLKGWTFDQFVTAVATSTRPDGTKLREPMTLLAPYGKAMTETERRALWAFLQSLPPVSKALAKP